MTTWIARIAGIIVAAGALTFAVGYAWLDSSLPQTEGTINVAGPSGDIEIIRDRHGVPTIFAGSESDAMFALGFVHAQDRLAQMSLMRLLAQGRLSEVIGPATLDQDRFMRAMAIVPQVEASYAALDPKWRDVLQSYAAGVNAFLENRSGALPPEFLLAGVVPEPWRPQDSLLWGKLMTLQLSGNWRAEIARARLAAKDGPQVVQQLWPEWPADAATTLGHLAALYRSIDLDRLAAALPPPLGPSTASNEWVLAGSHTRSGKPLLVNDPHLGLGAPGTWYLARIEAPGLILAGATAPGVPGVVLGHNGRIAWGFTTTAADTNDLFIERVDPDDPSRYLTPEGSRPFATRTETIKVKGGDDVVMTIRSTRNGVVLSDLSPSIAGIVPPRHVVALATPSFHGVDRTAAALFALNRAGNWDQFVGALRDWDAPIQNVVYADVAGHIGFYTPGLLPRRKAGDGWMPQPAWTGAYDWAGFVPFDEMPHAADPEAGQFVNANNRLVPEEFPIFISRDWDSPYRARRIMERLQAAPAHDVAGQVEILRDDVSLFAREWLDRLRDFAPEDAHMRQAFAMLRAWDGAMSRDRPEPLIFSAWTRELMIALLKDQFSDHAPSLQRKMPLFFRDVADGTSSFCDDTATQAVETCRQQLDAALGRALSTLTDQYGRDMTRWKWGEAHYAPFRNQLLDRIPGIDALIGFRVPTDGDYFTINRGAMRLTDSHQPFTHTHGAGLRAVYDLADLDASLFMITPGQSGNPLSPHWGDLARPWADGEHFQIRGDRTQLRKDGEVLMLSPRQ